MTNNVYKEHIYALFHDKTSSYVKTCGYYGNEHNIKAFETKEACQKYIDMHMRGLGYRPKKMKI